MNLAVFLSIDAIAWWLGAATLLSYRAMEMPETHGSYVTPRP